MNVNVIVFVGNMLHFCFVFLFYGPLRRHVISRSVMDKSRERERERCRNDRIVKAEQSCFRPSPSHLCDASWNPSVSWWNRLVTTHAATYLMLVPRPELHCRLRTAGSETFDFYFEIENEYSVFQWIVEIYIYIEVYRGIYIVCRRFGMYHGGRDNAWI